MAWVIILIATNIFYSNSRLKYNDRIISSLNNRKKKKLQKSIKYKMKQKERLKNEIRNLNLKHQRVINEYKRHKRIKSIAKNLKLGIRETRLVIKLYFN